MAKNQVQKLLETLRAIMPKNATMSHIKAGEAVLAAGAEKEGLREWAELCCLLGSFYLEVPEGNQIENILRAKELYQMVVRQAPDFNIATAALNGLANCVAVNSESTVSDFDNAIAELKMLIDQHKQEAGLLQIATLFATCAVLLLKRPGGDRIGALEEALQLRKDVVSMLESDPRFVQSAEMSRALYNLAVTHLSQESGIWHDHVNSAVLRLREALALRPAELDPLGRAKILRALTEAYPDWTGADSLTHAQALSQAAAKEAQHLAGDAEPVIAREQGWAKFIRQNSALTEDFEGLEHWPPEDINQYLSAVLSNHREALRVISEEDRPAKWAEWMGGQGRIFAAYYLYLRQDEYLDQAFTCYEAAVAPIVPHDHPRLYQKLQARIGELAHACKDWTKSMNAHMAAVEIGNSLYQLSKTRESRDGVLKEMRGLALFGAFAAAHCKEREIAIELAEMGRSRGYVDLILAAEIELASLPANLIQKVRQARTRVLELEAQLRAEGTDSVTQALNKLADSLRLSPNDLKTRITQDPEKSVEKAAAARIKIGGLLEDARKELRTALAEANVNVDSLLPSTLSAKDISALADNLGYPIIYLLPTMHGTMVLVVSPNGLIYSLSITGFGSRETNILLRGNEELPGYLEASIHAEMTELQASLAVCVPVLGGLISPITDLLNKMGYTEAALIPLGSLGQLPLHAATYDANAVYRLLSNARALGPLLGNQTNSGTGKNRMLFAIAPPHRDDQVELPYALTEILITAARFEETDDRIKLAMEGITNEQFFASATDSTHLHLACHAKFSPADPLASKIFIGQNNELTLEELIHHQGDFTGVQLAILSACQTAINDTELPDESTGFPNVLLTLGVQNVVSTSWPVDDLAALLFSYYFYLQLNAGKGAAEATVVASRWLRSLTAEEITTVARTMHSSVPPTTIAAQDSLTRIIADFGLSGSQTPFSDWIYCAAFSCYGL